MEEKRKTKRKRKRHKIRKNSTNEAAINSLSKNTQNKKWVKEKDKNRNIWNEKLNMIE